MIRRATTFGLSPTVMPRTSSARISAATSAGRAMLAASILPVVRATMASKASESRRPNTTPGASGGSWACREARWASTASRTAAARSAVTVAWVRAARSSRVDRARANAWVMRRSFATREAGMVPSVSARRAASAASNSGANASQASTHAVVRATTCWSVAATVRSREARTRRAISSVTGTVSPPLNVGDRHDPHQCREEHQCDDQGHRVHSTWAGSPPARSVSAAA